MSCASALAQTDPRWQNDERVGRAVKLAQNGAVHRLGEHTFEVKSQSGNGSYLVDLAGEVCGCPDHGKGNHCKHLKAAALVAGLIPA